jgi:hypothetical protein
VFLPRRGKTTSVLDCQSALPTLNFGLSRFGKPSPT